MEVILVGGSYDGKRIEVQEGIPFIKLIKKQHINYNVWQYNEIPRELNANLEIYKRFTLRGDDMLFDIYSEESLSPNQVMDFLIDGYRRKKINKDGFENGGNNGY